MKISTRETLLILSLLSMILLLAYYLLLLSPAQNRLLEKSGELDVVTAQKRIMDDIIEASKGISSEMEGYQSDIIELETSLLPMINSEAIARRLQQKFIDENIPFFVTVNTDTVENFRTLLPDGTFSPNTMQMVRFNISVSGSDGFLLTLIDEDEDDPTHVGYEEFIAAVKIIEEDYPNAVRIHSISFEDSGQGFIIYSVSVDVYAFSLPSRLSAIQRDVPFIRWEGIDLNDLELEGLVGIPIEMVPELKTEVVRPFAKFPVNMDMLMGVEMQMTDDVDDQAEDEDE